MLYISTVLTLVMLFLWEISKEVSFLDYSMQDRSIISATFFLFWLHAVHCPVTSCCCLLCWQLGCQDLSSWEAGDSNHPLRVSHLDFSSYLLTSATLPSKQLFTQLLGKSCQMSIPYFILSSQCSYFPGSKPMVVFIWYLLFYVPVCFACFVCLWTTWMPYPCGSQKTMLDPLELEL